MVLSVDGARIHWFFNGFSKASKACSFDMCSGFWKLRKMLKSYWKIIKIWKPWYFTRCPGRNFFCRKRWKNENIRKLPKTITGPIEIDRFSNCYNRLKDELPSIWWFGIGNYNVCGLWNSASKIWRQGVVRARSLGCCNFRFPPKLAILDLD